MPFPGASSFILKIRIACWQYTDFTQTWVLNCAHICTQWSSLGGSLLCSCLSLFLLPKPASPSSPPLYLHPSRTSWSISFHFGEWYLQGRRAFGTLTLCSDLQFTKPCDTHSLIQLLQQPPVEREASTSPRAWWLVCNSESECFNPASGISVEKGWDNRWEQVIGRKAEMEGHRWHSYRKK